MGSLDYGRLVSLLDLDDSSFATEVQAALRRSRPSLRGTRPPRSSQPAPSVFPARASSEASLPTVDALDAADAAVAARLQDEEIRQASLAADDEAASASVARSLQAEEDASVVAARSQVASDSRCAKRLEAALSRPSAATASAARSAAQQSRARRVRPGGDDPSQLLSSSPRAATPTPSASLSPPSPSGCLLDPSSEPSGRGASDRRPESIQHAASGGNTSGRCAPTPARTRHGISPRPGGRAPAPVTPCTDSTHTASAPAGSGSGASRPSASAASVAGGPPPADPQRRLELEQLASRLLPLVLPLVAGQSSSADEELAARVVHLLLDYGTSDLDRACRSPEHLSSLVDAALLAAGSSASTDATRFSTVLTLPTDPAVTPDQLRAFWASHPAGALPVVLFWQSIPEHRALSNWYSALPFEYEFPHWCDHAWLRAQALPTSVRCTTGEHALMLCKSVLMRDAPSFRAILDASLPGVVQRLGRDVRPFDDALWLSRVCAASLSIARARTLADDAVRSVLVQYPSHYFAEAAPRDTLHGIGLAATDPGASSPASWRGANVLGWAYTVCARELAAVTIEPSQTAWQSVHSTPKWDVPAVREAELRARSLPDEGHYLPRSVRSPSPSRGGEPGGASGATDGTPLTPSQQLRLGQLQLEQQVAQLARDTAQLTTQASVDASADDDADFDANIDDPDTMGESHEFNTPPGSTDDGEEGTCRTADSETRSVSAPHAFRDVTEHLASVFFCRNGPTAGLRVWLHSHRDGHRQPLQVCVGSNFAVALSSMQPVFGLADSWAAALQLALSRQPQGDHTYVHECTEEVPQRIRFATWVVALTDEQATVSPNYPEVESLGIRDGSMGWFTLDATLAAVQHDAPQNARAALYARYFTTIASVLRDAVQGQPTVLAGACVEVASEGHLPAPSCVPVSGEWSVREADPSCHPELQARTLRFVWQRVKGEWHDAYVISDSAILHRAKAPPGLGVYAWARLKNGCHAGRYGGRVVACGDTQASATSAAEALQLFDDSCLRVVRMARVLGWLVVDGAQESVPPHMELVNDPYGSGLQARCVASEYGNYRARMDIPALDLKRPVLQQWWCELSVDYGWSAANWTRRSQSGTADAPVRVAKASTSDDIALDLGPSSAPAAAAVVVPSFDATAFASPPSETEASSCSLCGLRTNELARCCSTGRWFCNTFPGADSSRTCIITHLVENGYSAIALHSSSRWQPTAGNVLRCTATRCSDVFRLGVALRDKATLYVLERRASRSVCPGYGWYAFVNSLDGAAQSLSSWLVPGSTGAVSLAARTSARRRGLLDSPSLPLAVHADTVSHYQTFAPLVALLAQYDERASRTQVLEDIVFEWGVGRQGEPVAYFDMSLVRSSEALALYDRVIVRRDAGDEATAAQETTELRGMVTFVLDRTVGVSVVGVGCSVDTQVTTGYSLRRERITVSFDRMQTALLNFSNDTLTAVGAHLQQAILNAGAAQPPFRLVRVPDSVSVGSSSGPANPQQTAAVLHALKYPFTCVKGPPGTGKTATAARIVYHLSRQAEGPVLLTAASNVATDQDAITCASYGLRVIRYFASTREQRANSSSLPDNLRIHHYAPENATLQRLVQLTGRVPLNKAHRAQLKKLQRKVYHEALRKVDVVCCTCSAAGDNLLAAIRFNSCLIDEAAQVMEPEALIPVCLGVSRLILVGDECQLRPVVLSDAAAQGGLAVSLFERSLAAGCEPVVLREQYRMHPAISAFPSEHFYGGQLKDGPATPLRLRRDVAFPWPQPDRPIMFWHCRHDSGCEELGSSREGSYSNPVEARACIDAVLALLGTGRVEVGDITVITTYEAQRQLLLGMARQVNSSLASLEIGNVDAVQGRQRSFVILSLVRSNALKGERAVGFVRDPRRSCVALTRAESGMIIIGDAITLANCDTWAAAVRSYQAAQVLVEGKLQQLQSFQLPVVAAAQPLRVADFAASLYTAEQNNVVPNASHRDARSLVTPEGLRPSLPQPARPLNEPKRARRRHRGSIGTADDALRASYDASRVRPFARAIVSSYGARAEPLELESMSPLHAVAECLACTVEVDSPSTREFGMELPTDLAAVAADYLNTYDATAVQWCTTPAAIALYHHASTQRQAFLAERALEQRNLPQFGAVGLAYIRLLQFWLRSRIFGYISSAESIVYWRLANSGVATQRGRLSAFVTARSYRYNPELCTLRGVVRSERGVLRGHFPRLRPSGGCILFRLVRRMRCGYGAMACRHSVRDMLGQPVRDAAGKVVRRCAMATQSDFDRWQADVDMVTRFYQASASCVQSFVPDALLVAGFCSPGGHAEGARQAGYAVSGIDIAENLSDARDWFGSLQPSLYPDSPTVVVHSGNALREEVRREAVALHPTNRRVVGHIETPECDKFSTMASVSGKQRPGGAPARRGVGSRDGDRENLSECVHKRQAHYVVTGETYWCETVGSAAFPPPEGVACTALSGIQLGMRTHDRHKFYHPVEHTLFVDQPLRAAGLWLDAHTCAGSSRSLAPLHPHGMPVKPFCCPGELASLVNNGYFGYTHRQLCKILGVHPEHVTAKSRLNDLLPPRLSRHAVAVMSVWIAQSLLHVPAVSYDQAIADPRLAFWSRQLLQQGGSRGAPSLATKLRVFLVALPANVEDTVVVDGAPDCVGSMPQLPSVVVENKGALATVVARAFRAQYVGVDVTEQSLCFVCDFLSLPEPALVFATDSMPCNDAHALARGGRAELSADGVISGVGGGGAGGLRPFVGVSLSRYCSLINGIEGAQTLARAALTRALLLYPRRGYDTAEISRVLQTTLQSHRSTVEMDTSLIADSARLLRAEQPLAPTPAAGAFVAETRAFARAPTVSLPPLNDDARLVTIETTLLSSFRQVCATAAASVTVPDNLRAEYAKACSDLGVPYDADTDTINPANDRGGGGGFPNPVVSTAVCVVVRWQGRVLTYARSSQRLCLFSAPAVATMALTSTSSDAQRSARFADVMSALLPWFSGHSFMGHLRVAVENACEGPPTITSWTLSTRNESGRLVSMGIAARAVVIHVYCVQLNSSVDWAALPTVAKWEVKNEPNYELRLHVPQLLQARWQMRDVFTTRQSLSPLTTPSPLEADCFEGDAALSFDTLRLYSVNEAVLSQHLDDVGCKPLALALLEAIRINTTADVGVAVANLALPVPASRQRAVGNYDSRSAAYRQLADRVGAVDDATLEELWNSGRDEEARAAQEANWVLHSALWQATFDALHVHGSGNVDPNAYRQRHWADVFCEATQLEDLRAGRVTRLVRLWDSLNSRVSKRWLLRCHSGIRSFCVWVEVCGEPTRYDSYSEALREHSLATVPGLDLATISDAELEYQFYISHVGNQHAARQLRTWSLRVGQAGSLVSWPVRLLSPRAVVPRSRRLAVDITIRDSRGGVRVPPVEHPRSFFRRLLISAQFVTQRQQDPLYMSRARCEAWARRDDLRQEPAQQGSGQISDPQAQAACQHNFSRRHSDEHSAGSLSSPSASDGEDWLSVDTSEAGRASPSVHASDGSRTPEDSDTASDYGEPVPELVAEGLVQIEVWAYLGDHVLSINVRYVRDLPTACTVSTIADVYETLAQNGYAREVYDLYTSKSRGYYSRRISEDDNLQDLFQNRTLAEVWARPGLCCWQLRRRDERRLRFSLYGVEGGDGARSPFAVFAAIANFDTDTVGAIFDAVETSQRELGTRRDSTLYTWDTRTALDEADTIQLATGHVNFTDALDDRDCVKLILRLNPPPDDPAELTVGSLAGLGEAETAQLLRSRVTPLVQLLEPSRAPAIVDLLLASDVAELVELVASPSRLAERVASLVASLSAPEVAPSIAVGPSEGSVLTAEPIAETDVVWLEVYWAADRHEEDELATHVEGTPTHVQRRVVDLGGVDPLMTVRASYSTSMGGDVYDAVACRLHAKGYALSESARDFKITNVASKALKPSDTLIEFWRNRSYHTVSNSRKFTTFLVWPLPRSHEIVVTHSSAEPPTPPPPSAATSDPSPSQLTPPLAASDSAPSGS